MKTTTANIYRKEDLKNQDYSRFPACEITINDLEIDPHELKKIELLIYVDAEGSANILRNRHFKTGRII